MTGTAPTAVNDSYSVATGTTLTVPAASGVLANDAKGTPAATITANTLPTHGMLTLNSGDGSFVYTPSAGYVGADSFTYTLTNSVGSSTATVSIIVTGTAPTAVNDSYSVTTGTTLTVPAATGVLANDTKGSPTATITTVSTPMHGSVMLNTSDGSFTYMPTSGYVGADSFSYTISNGNGTFGTGSSTATVSIIVTGIAPTAVNDSYSVTTGTTLTVPAATGVLANDTKGSPAATITASTLPTHGMLTLNSGDGSFVYTPAAGYIGADTFTYTLTNSVGSSTATVTVTVNGVAPAAVADSASVTTGLSVTSPRAGERYPRHPRCHDHGGQYADAWHGNDQWRERGLRPRERLRGYGLVHLHPDEQRGQQHRHGDGDGERRRPRYRGGQRKCDHGIERHDPRAGERYPRHPRCHPHGGQHADAWHGNDQWRERGLRPRERIRGYGLLHLHPDEQRGQQHGHGDGDGERGNGDRADNRWSARRHGRQHGHGEQPGDAARRQAVADNHGHV